MKPIILKILLGLGMVLSTIVAHASEQVYYFHNDHLGTPQVMSDASGSKVWEAEYEPFGKAAVNQDPDGDGQIVINNLRFPGQYYDAESGLHYNYHRHYDPDTGRYLQPDPIGLDGGPNLYPYVSNNPVSNVDPDGRLAVPAVYIALTAGAGAAAGLKIYLQSPAGQQAIQSIRDLWRNFPPPNPPPLFCETRQPPPPERHEVGPLEECVNKCNLYSETTAARYACYVKHCGLIAVTQILRMKWPE